MIIRNALLAAAFTGLLSASAFAQSAPRGPVLQDEGWSPTVVYDAPSANIVGGAIASVTGSPDAMQYETHRVDATQRPVAPQAYVYGTRQAWQIEVDSNS
ncbi:hypothetical protein [Roseococcus sp. YIM B11640]|uniref:hypothetical protein n=1 Tax=Roseococcus sp. YIM B11640 TaxID=3133973 RepID=UPI003C798070